MSTTKTAMSQAANTQGLPLDITDVFSTYLYTGTGAAQTITNDIDLAGEGGLVWIKNRGSGNATWHYLFDTERNAGLYSNSTSAEFPTTGLLNSFNSDGFTLGGTVLLTQTSNNFASWTFRKAPKFFDVVTYTGDGTVRQIPHNLGAVPGAIIVKQTNGTGNWFAQHISTGPTKSLFLDTTSAATTRPEWDNTAPTDSVFTVGTISTVNASGGTYVAYLFAHNDGDGEFGPNGDQDIIKCGSYTGNGSSTGPVIDLGFEPQWILTKRTDSISQWSLIDSMRGMPVYDSDVRLYPNLTNVEDHAAFVNVTPTGFNVATTGTAYNTSGGTYIYIAIRRGPLAPPESGTEVFKAISTTPSSTTPVNTGFTVDTVIAGTRTATAGLSITNRLRNTLIRPNNPQQDYGGSNYRFDVSDGYLDVYNTLVSPSQEMGYHMFSRAPKFYDQVCYKAAGGGASTNLKPHNLTAAPEMLWIKRVNDSGQNWVVWHKDMNYNLGESYINKAFMYLNSPTAAVLSSNFWSYNGNPQMTDTHFSVGSTYDEVNNTTLGAVYMAYLFASLNGVSKVGSYTGNGSSQTINCGFTTGARFILIKRTNSTGDWYIWDTARGIVAGNDPHLSLNTTVAEVTTDDSVDPDNSGFIVNQLAATNINVTSASYIFYAVA